MSRYRNFNKEDQHNLLYNQTYYHYFLHYILLNCICIFHHLISWFSSSLLSILLSYFSKDWIQMGIICIANFNFRLDLKESMNQISNLHIYIIHEITYQKILKITIVFNRLFVKIY